MPEASVYENYFPVFWKDHIWFAWEPFIMQPISKSVCKKSFSHYNFWLRIAAPYFAHVEASYFLRMDIRHILILVLWALKVLLHPRQGDLRSPLRQV